jgi:hypothetical protein
MFFDVLLALYFLSGPSFESNFKQILWHSSVESGTHQAPIVSVFVSVFVFVFLFACLFFCLFVCLFFLWENLLVQNVDILAPARRTKTSFLHRLHIYWAFSGCT